MSMERLTKRNEYDRAYYPYCFKENTCGGFGSSEKCDECDFNISVCEKLADYEDLEEQGRLIKLPCKVGDTIYRINQYAKEPIISMKVLQVRLGELCIGNSFLRIDAINDEDMGEFFYFKENIGKTVFLTKEEAEKALAEMGE